MAVQFPHIAIFKLRLAVAVGVGSEAVFFCPAIYEHLRVHFVHGHVALLLTPWNPLGFIDAERRPLENGTSWHCDRV